MLFYALFRFWFERFVLVNFVSYTERLGEVRFFLSAELPIFLYIKDISLLEAKNYMKGQSPEEGKSPPGCS